MIRDTNNPPAETTPHHGDQQKLLNWMFRDRQSAEKRFGMELEKVLELYNSDDGRKRLLEQMQQADPALNGNVEGALDQVNLNMEQLKKKESFFGKMLKLPGRTLKGALGVMKRHPVLTTLAILALAAAGVAGGFYLAGEWELFATKVGLNKIGPALKNLKELMWPMPGTTPLPDGGMLDVPVPYSQPGGGIAV